MKKKLNLMPGVILLVSIVSYYAFQHRERNTLGVILREKGIIFHDKVVHAHLMHYQYPCTPHAPT